MFTTKPKKLLLASLATSSILMFSGTVAAEQAHWTYYGEEGPAHWGELLDSQGEVAFPLCGTGTEQSPIDIYATTEVNLSGNKIKFNYHPTPLEIKHNGHTIQVNYASGLGSVKSDGETYDLLQFHFHEVSEHTLDNEHAALEGHLVISVMTVYSL